MTEINIEGVIFQIKQLFGVYCVFDSADSMVGRADNLPDAVAICEQIAWRRKVDGKVAAQTIDVDEKQFTSCLDCEYYKKILTDQTMSSGRFVEIGFCCINSNQYTTLPDNYSCNRAKRRT